jgi:hypothetical protein
LKLGDGSSKVEEERRKKGRDWRGDRIDINMETMGPEPVTGLVNKIQDYTYRPIGTKHPLNVTNGGTMALLHEVIRSRKIPNRMD